MSEGSGQTARCRVRAARLSDIDDLVTVEMNAFCDVYGKDRSAATVEKVRNTFTARFHLLGNWFRVLDDAQEGVIGMVTGCPTGMDGDRLAKLMMNDISMTRTAYQPDGSVLFVVNLAVDQTRQSPGRAFDLLADLRRLSDARGIQEVYFRSRLPGLATWAQRKNPHLELSGLSEQQRSQLALEYSKLTTTRLGVEGPADPLLRFYCGIGFEPLQVVEGWPEDHPSLGRAVFFRSLLTTGVGVKP